MTILRTFFFILLLFSACSHKPLMENNFKVKEIALMANVKILVPIQEKEFSDSLIYTNIEIWIDSKLVFRDTTLTEYFFEMGRGPKARKTINDEFEVVLPVFDAPDFNKLWVFYFKDGLLIKKEVLPFFDKDSEDLDRDGKKEYWGIMHVIDAYENSDSCYYNPTLYYEITDVGIQLDSTLTIEKNSKFWGGFYGFDFSDKVLPCKQ